MKTRLLLIVALVGVSLISLCQDAVAEKKMRYVPEHGFWEIVTNLNDNQVVLIRYYNDDSQLIFEEKLTGVKVNLKKHRTLRHLKQELDKVLLAWRQQKQPLPSINPGVLIAKD